MSKTALIKFIALNMSHCTPLISKWEKLFGGKLEQLKVSRELCTHNLFQQEFGPARGHQTGLDDF